MSRRSQGGGCAGDKEYDDNRDKVNGDEVNGDEVNGDVLQWCVATRNGVGLTLVGYNWGVGRGVMLR